MTRSILALCLISCAASTIFGWALAEAAPLLWQHQSQQQQQQHNLAGDSTNNNNNNNRNGHLLNTSDEVVDQLMESVVNDPSSTLHHLQQQQQQQSANNNNNNNNNNFNNLYPLGFYQQKEPSIYSSLRGPLAASTSFVPAFSSGFVLSPTIGGGTNGVPNNNQNQLYFSTGGTGALLARAAQSSQSAGPSQLDGLDFDAFDWETANLMREGRAYKPKIMSTARGFGKRSFGSAGASRHITYADLLASANPANNFAINHNLSGHGLR